MASVRSCATRRGRKYWDSSFHVVANSCCVIEDTVDRWVEWSGLAITRWPTNDGVIPVDDRFSVRQLSSSPSLDESVSSTSSSNDRRAIFSLLECFRRLFFEIVARVWYRLLDLSELPSIDETSTRGTATDGDQAVGLVILSAKWEIDCSDNGAHWLSTYSFADVIHRQDQRHSSSYLGNHLNPSIKRKEITHLTDSWIV